MLEVIILAAGRGTRMQSKFPKVLHPIAGKAILAHILETVQLLHPHQIHVVVGYERDQIQTAMQAYAVNWVGQSEQLGTAHAVQQVLPHLAPETKKVLVLCGDAPLFTVATLQKLLALPEGNLSLLTAKTFISNMFGRVIRDHYGEIERIVEFKDATAEEKNVHEFNPSFYLFSKSFLMNNLEKINNQNANHEYYITALIQLAIQQKLKIHSALIEDEREAFSINDRAELAIAERYWQLRTARAFQLQGITIIDPARFDCRGKSQIEKDVTLDIDVILDGNNYINQDCYIGSHTIIKNCRLGKRVQIKGHCVIEDAIIHDDCVIGPFARIRPGTELKSGVHIGNFVEIKKTLVGNETKINHLSYIGDATIGERVNVGAGTITCNYDGIHKHQTIIEDGAFIGSDTQLVAPVTVGKNATIGAGSTITKNAPAEQLTLSRADQKTVTGWQRNQD